MHILETDGGLKPGPYYAFVVRDPDGMIVHQFGGRMEKGSTNNACEYSALIAGLYWCEAQGISPVQVRSDSQLVVRQMQGQYAVRSENVRPYYEEAKAQAAKVGQVKFKWVPREENELADRIGREAWA